MVAYFPTNMTNPFGVLEALFSMVDVLKFVIFQKLQKFLTIPDSSLRSEVENSRAGTAILRPVLVMVDTVHSSWIQLT
jgi:hypothetical protein